jgi:hypothetical protein
MKLLPAKRDLTVSYRASLIVAAFMAVASAAGLLLGFGGLYGPHPALGVTEAEAGLLLPGLMAVSSVAVLPYCGRSLYDAHPTTLVGLVGQDFVTLAAIVPLDDAEEIRFAKSPPNEHAVRQWVWQRLTLPFRFLWFR